MTKEELKDKVAMIKEQYTYKEEFKKSSYYQTVKIWEKGDKLRVYIPRNAYEQAGYITLDAKDIYKSNSGELNGIFYQASRPGNTSDLRNFITDLTNQVLL